MNAGEIAKPDVSGVIPEDGGSDLTRLAAPLRQLALCRRFSVGTRYKVEHRFSLTDTQ
jgi:hypothetical protein